MYTWNTILHLLKLWVCSYNHVNWSKIRNRKLKNMKYTYDADLCSFFVICCRWLLTCFGLHCFPVLWEMVWAIYIFLAGNLCLPSIASSESKAWYSLRAAGQGQVGKMIRRRKKKKIKKEKDILPSSSLLFDYKKGNQWAHMCPHPLVQPLRVASWSPLHFISYLEVRVGPYLPNSCFTLFHCHNHASCTSSCMWYSGLQNFPMFGTFFKYDLISKEINYINIWNYHWCCENISSSGTCQVW